MAAQNKKLSTDQIRASLHIGNPPAAALATSSANTGGQSNGGASLAAGESLIRLHIKSVRPYKHNPRTKPNECYVEIRESIRVRGLDNIFKVTKRPGEDFYFPARGGNTRLQALHELFDETGEDKYAYIDFVYTEFTSEADVRAGHIIENNNRSDLVFWDNAVALSELKAEIEHDLNERLSNRQYAAILAQRGVQIGRETLRTYSFATEKLADLGAAAMQLSGGGVREIIIPTYLKLSKLAAKFEVPEDQFQAQVCCPVLQEIAHRFDAEKVFAIEDLCEGLFTATARVCAQDVQAVRKMLVLLDQQPSVTRDELIAPQAPNANKNDQSVNQTNGGPQSDGTVENQSRSMAADPGGESDEQTSTTGSPSIGSASGHRNKSTEILYASNLTPGDHTRKPQENPTGDLEFGGENDGAQSNDQPDNGSNGVGQTSDNAPALDAAPSGAHATANSIPPGDPKSVFLDALHAFARAADLTDSLRFDEAMPLWFYVDLPLPADSGIPLDIESQSEGKNPHRYLAWWYLANLSGIVIEKSRARAALPNDCAIAIALSDDELWDDEIRNTIGDPLYESTLGQMLNWMADPTNAIGELLLDLLATLRAVHSHYESRFDIAFNRGAT